MDRSTLVQNHVDPASDLKRSTQPGFPGFIQGFNHDTAVTEDGVQEESRVPAQERQLYRSENGDRWSLARDPDSGRVIVRHRPHLPSGGQVSDTSLGEFLVQGGLGPEKQELLRLIGTLVDGAEVRYPEPQDQPADQTRPDIPGSDAMPKGQQKSNKEIKTPKKEKPSAAPAPSFEKGLNPSSGTPKKKG